MFLTRESNATCLREIALPTSPPESAAAHAARLARLPRFVGLSQPPGTILDRLKLAIIGGGGSVGRAISLAAARLHLHTLWIVDGGSYKVENLLTQPIFPGDVGQAKATNTGIACKSLSPTTRVFVHDGRVQSLDPLAFDSADLIVMSVDNIAAEIDVAQRALHLGVPLVHAAVHGETMVALIRTYGNIHGQGPCPACVLGPQEWEELNRHTLFSCSGNESPVASPVPTVSTSFLCALAASMAMVQITRHVLGLGASVLDTQLLHCGYTFKSTVSRLRRKPDCACEHIAFERIGIGKPLNQCTLAELAERAGFGPAFPADLTFRLDPFDYVESSSCCGELQPVRRFRLNGDPIGRCSQCGGELSSMQFYRRRSVPASHVDLRTCLWRLGAVSPAHVVVSSRGRAALVRTEFGNKRN